MLDCSLWLSGSAVTHSFFPIHYDYNSSYFLNNGRVIHKAFLWDEVQTLSKHVNNCPATTYPGSLSRKAGKVRLQNSLLPSAHVRQADIASDWWLRARVEGGKLHCSLGSVSEPRPYFAGKLLNLTNSFRKTNSLLYSPIRFPWEYFWGLYSFARAAIPKYTDWVA